MKSFLSIITLAVVLNKTYGAPTLNYPSGSPYRLNNLGVNNLVPIGIPSSSFGIAPTFSASYVPNNYANAILEPIANTNIIATPNEVLSNVVPNTIASATCMPNNLSNIELTNVQFTPVLSELMPSLQFGDITVAGDLPIGGTIKVCGCIPVYGMITVDGAVPSTGTAIVADMLCNEIADKISTCPNQFVS